MYNKIVENNFKVSAMTFLHFIFIIITLKNCSNEEKSDMLLESDIFIETIFVNFKMTDNFKATFGITRFKHINIFLKEINYNVYI